MARRTECRVRWEHLRHLYIYTTHDSLIFSYESLDPSDALEKNVISLMKPVKVSSGLLSSATIALDRVSDNFEQFRGREGAHDMRRVPPAFFREKLVSVVCDSRVDENYIRDRSRAFEHGKGFQLNTGSLSGNRRQLPQDPHGPAEGAPARAGGSDGRDGRRQDVPRQVRRRSAVRAEVPVLPLHPAPRSGGLGSGRIHADSHRRRAPVDRALFLGVFRRVQHFGPAALRDRAAQRPRVLSFGPAGE